MSETMTHQNGPDWNETPERQEIFELRQQLTDSQRCNVTLTACFESAIAKEFANDPTGTNKRSGDLLDDFACWVEHHAKVEQERDSLKNRIEEEQRAAISIATACGLSGVNLKGLSSCVDAVKAVCKRVEELEKEREEWIRQPCRCACHDLPATLQQ